MPIDHQCFIRVSVILLRGEGQPVFRPYRAKAVYSSGDCGDPEPTFGKGGPAGMLVLAAAACHAAELGAALDLVALPWNLIEVQTDATCTAVPSAPCLDTLAVYPIIYGADPGKRSQAAVLRFRDGLMADARVYYDAASLHHQLGIATCAP